MPDIFSTDSARPIQTNGSTVIQPVREATPLLVGKLVFALLIPILIYILIQISSLEIASYFSISDNVSMGFLIFLVILTLMQVFFVVLITLQWKNHVYYLTENYIQENNGVFTHTERMFDLKNVRDISIKQGVLGRLWNYGDLIIESTAPDFHEVILIIGAPDPREHESFLQKYIRKS